MLTDALQRAALARSIADRARVLADRGGDAILALDRLLGRLELGLRYGELDLGADRRDWRRERFEERLDALVYDVFDELVLEDHARGQLREQARAEMAGAPVRARTEDGKIIEAPLVTTTPVRQGVAQLDAGEFAGEPTRASSESVRLALEDIAEPYAGIGFDTSDVEGSQ